MLRLTYDKLTDGDSKNNPESEVAWDNLVEISSIFHLELVVAASTAWFRANPNSTLQDFERRLRAQKLPVYLIASVPEQVTDDNRTHQKLLDIHFNSTPEPLTYALRYCCRPESSAQREILDHSDSYEDNFAKLAKTGIYQIGDSDEPPNKSDTQKIKETALAKNDIVTLVSYNMVRLKLETLTELQINNKMNQDIAEATKISGEPSEAKPIGTAPDGSPILAHFVKDKVISEYGLMISPSQQTKIVVVTDQTTWTGFS
jgi:hypothetical protein